MRGASVPRFRFMRGRKNGVVRGGGFAGGGMVNFYSVRFFALLLALFAGVVHAEDFPAVKLWYSDGVTSCVTPPGKGKGSAIEAARCAASKVAIELPLDGVTLICSATPVLKFSEGSLPSGVAGQVVITARYASNPCAEYAAGSVSWQYECPDGGDYVSAGNKCRNVPPCPPGNIRGATGQCVCPRTNVPGPCPDCVVGQDVQVYGSEFRSGKECTANHCEVEAVGFCAAIGGSNKSCSARVTGNVCVPPAFDEPQTPTVNTDVPIDVDPGTADLLRGCMALGRTYGTVNGVGVCLARGTPGGADTESEGTKTQTQTNPDGKLTETTTQVVVETSSTGTVNIRTTTTTTTDKGGPSESTRVETRSETGKKPEVCAANPDVAACRGDGKGSGGGTPEGGGGGGGGTPSGGDGGTVAGSGSAFGGSCAGGFTCEGDPIQCAIAREQHKRNCELHKETDQSALFASAIGGSDPGLEALKKDNRQVTDMATVIDTSRFLGGSCVEDLNIPFGSLGEVTLPFSKMCPYLAMMGNIVVAFSMLAAARIIYV